MPCPSACDRMSCCSPSDRPHVRTSPSARRFLTAWAETIPPPTGGRPSPPSCVPAAVVGGARGFPAQRKKPESQLRSRSKHVKPVGAGFVVVSVVVVGGAVVVVVVGAAVVVGAGVVIGVAVTGGCRVEALARTDRRGAGRPPATDPRSSARWPDGRAEPCALVRRSCSRLPVWSLSTSCCTSSRGTWAQCPKRWESWAVQPRR